MPLGRSKKNDRSELVSNTCVLIGNASPHGRELFYSAMEDEFTRLMAKVETSTKEELVSQLAMQNIYTLLAVLDSETPQTNPVPELEVRKCDVDRVTKTARQCFASDAYDPFNIDKIGDPNETWEEFIYAESRRRYAISIPLRYIYVFNSPFNGLH